MYVRLHSRWDIRDVCTHSFSETLLRPVVVSSEVAEQSIVVPDLTAGLAGQTHALQCTDSSCMEHSTVMHYMNV